MKLIIFVFAQMMVIALKAASLDVNISELKKGTGKMIVYLCDNKRCHDEIQSIQRENQFHRLAGKQIVDITKQGDLNVHFDHLQPGKYSVFCLHDLNGNEVPDFNGKLPLEPFGIYKMEEVGLPPNFEDAHVEMNSVDEKASVNISLLEIENGALKFFLPMFGNKETKDFDDHVKLLMALNGGCSSPG